MYSAEGYFYVRWHLVLFARVLGSLLVHMSPLFAARPGMHLTAVVSTNVENAAILTAASVLPPREQGSIKSACCSWWQPFPMMTTADCVGKWLGSLQDGTDLNSDSIHFFFIWLAFNLKETCPFFYRHLCDTCTFFDHKCRIYNVVQMRLNLIQKK